jgi:hypothetical protein
MRTHRQSIKSLLVSLIQIPNLLIQGERHRVLAILRLHRYQFFWLALLPLMGVWIYHIVNRYV